MPDHNPARRIAAQILRERVERAMAPWLNAIVPVYAGEGLQLRHVGTGLLISVAGGTFLCTAAHVLDERHNGNLWFGGEHPIRVLGRFTETSAPTGQSRAEDVSDVAVVHLSTGPVGVMGDLRPIPIEHISAPYEPTERDYVLLSGYPFSKGGGREGDAEREPYLYSTVAVPAGPGAYTSRGLNPVLSQLFGFTKRKSFVDGIMVTAPDLHGMSGGAAWLIEDYMGPGEPRLKLLGILTEWLRRDALVQASTIHLGLAGAAVIVPPVAVERARHFGSAS